MSIRAILVVFVAAWTLAGCAAGPNALTFADRAVFDDLNDLMTRWNAAAAPVVELLGDATVEPADWAAASVQDRQTLRTIAAEMAEVASRAIHPPGRVALEALAANYGVKIASIDALAEASLSNDPDGAQSAIDAWTAAVADVPGLFRGLLAAYGEDMPPDLAKALREVFGDQ